MQRISTSALLEIYKQSTGVCTDTRQIKENVLFFCLRGESFNGNKFAQKAADAQSLKVVVDDPTYYDPESMILVDDSLKALQDLATTYRHSLKIPFIGITGTNGKTTTKELVATVLAKKFKTAATKGNFNNHIGVPLTLLSIDAEDEIAVVEMGANHVGEIAELCTFSNPDVGLITSIGKAHLEGFGSFEGVIKAKTELYKHIEKKGSHLFVKAENSILMEAAGSLPKTTYGSLENVDVKAQLISAAPFLKLTWKGHTIQTQLVGAYNFDNALAAIAIALYYQVSEQNIVSALEEYEPTNKRSQYIETAHNNVIMDAYNANPTSMDLAIKSFAEQAFDNKWMILGDMLELGKDSEQEHLKIIEEVKELAFENVIFVGPEFKKFQKQFLFPFYDKVEELKTLFEKETPQKATFLIKGSRGIHLEDILNQL